MYYLYTTQTFEAGPLPLNLTTYFNECGDPCHGVIEKSKRAGASGHNEIHGKCPALWVTASVFKSIVVASVSPL